MTSDEFEILLEKASTGDVDTIRAVAFLCYKMAEGGIENNDISKANEFMETGDAWKRAADEFEGNLSDDFYRKLCELTRSVFPRQMDKMDKIEETVIQLENDLFTGAFSESVVRSDLEARATKDRLSKYGSSGRQTDELGQKKRVYNENFQEYIDLINTVLGLLDSSHPYVSRLKRCENQVNKLRGIVSGFREI